MKAKVFMTFLILVLILVNVSVFLLSINTVIVLAIVSGFAVVCKVFDGSKFSDIYNIHSFTYKISSNNVLEIVGSFLVGVIACQGIPHFNIIDFVIYILFSLLVYRFLFFDLSKNIFTKKYYNDPRVM